MCTFRNGKGRSACGIVTTAIVSGRVPAVYRHIYRGRLGQCLLGTLLELGSERGLGSYHDAGLCSAAPLYLTQEIPVAEIFPFILPVGLPVRTDYVFRGQFLAGRNAQLCVGFVEANMILPAENRWLAE